jgi:hypothetical protein
MATADDYLATTREAFLNLKKLGDKTFLQLREEDFHSQLSSEVNSIAVTIQHVAGNQRSRFTDFLTTDGEKPDRHRDREFEEQQLSRDQLIELWENGWSILFAAIDPLRADDLERIVTIREEPHTVIKALQRQLSHYAYHVGQIVLIAKHLKGKDWETLSIPKGKSEEYLRVAFKAS